MKNKIFIIIAALMLISPVYSVEENTGSTDSFPVQEELAVTEDVVSEENAESVENQETAENVETAETEDVSALKELVSTPYKQPTSKRRLVKKFLLAMAGVAGSSLIIFAGLSIYNRVRESFIGVNGQGSRDLDSLETPDNITDAVKSFVDKTRWG